MIAFVEGYHKVHYLYMWMHLIVMSRVDDRLKFFDLLCQVSILNQQFLHLVTAVLQLLRNERINEINANECNRDNNIHSVVHVLHACNVYNLLCTCNTYMYSSLSTI